MTTVKPLHALMVGAAIITLSACTSASTVTVTAAAVSTASTTAKAAAPTTTTAQPTTTTPKPQPTTTTPKPTVDPKRAQAAAISEWYNGGGGDIMQKITDGENDITSAANDLDVAGLAVACSNLKDAANEAEAYGPIPATTVQTDWAQAIGYIQRAASSCLSGDFTSSASFIGLAGSHIESANSALQKFVQ